MKLIVTGATGFTGGEVLKQALADDAIERVTVLTRRPLGLSHPKLNELIVKDFTDYSAVDLSGHDACVWALGVSQTQVSEEDYIKITHDYTLAAAKAMFAANDALRFCFVSGRNADQDEKPKTALYRRIKGRAEKHLLALGRDVVIFRPAYIKPTKESGSRKDFARYFQWVGSIASFFDKDFYVDCVELARKLIDVAKNGSSDKVLENSAIKAP